MMLGGCAGEEASSDTEPSNTEGTTKAEDTTAAPATAQSTTQASATEETALEETTAEESDEPAQTLAQTLSDTIGEYDFHGVAYAVYGGNVVLNYGNNFNSNTVFRIASVSKQFTAAAVLKLCEQGKLSVDDSLDKFFPEYNGAANATVHHLLAMRSGITDYVIASQDADANSSEVSAANSAKTNRDAIRSWIFQNTYPAPDISYSYSNTNYFLLAEIIEQVSGMSYEDYITENFLKPLGMNSTGFQDTWNRTDLELAYGYGDGAYGFYEYNGARFGCGDMMSTAEDLAKWAGELVSGSNTVLSDNIISQMTQNYESAGYGYGLMINENYNTVYHPGDLPPYKSVLSVCRDNGLIIIMMDNIEGTNLQEVYKELLKNANSVLN